MKTTLLIGSGISNQAALLFLKKQNPAKLFIVSDSRPLNEASAAFFSAHNARVFVGDQNDPEHLAGFESGINLAIVSPGISPNAPLVQRIRDWGIKTISEVDLVLPKIANRYIAITGTNGKSTTTALCAHLLKEAGHQAVACGNIGLSLCEAYMEHDQDCIYVIELSSYQLEWAQHLAAGVALITNLSPDHLQRHGDFKSYLAAKWKIFSSASSAPHAVATSSAMECLRSHGFKLAKEIPLTLIDERSLSRIATWGLKSRHDDINLACAAKAAALLLGVNESSLLPYAKNFKGLPHRLEIVSDKGRYRVINDSKATNADSVCSALAAIETTCILLLGGQGKGENFADALRPYFGKIHLVLCFGQDATKISHQLGSACPTEIFATMKEAVTAALQIGPQLRIDVLFSPGCASFDEFRNFEDRGDQFRALVKALH